MLQTRYSLSERKPEVHKKGNRVERTGYISAQKRIENLLQAGVNLRNYRQNQYDFDHNKIDFDAYDKTRKKGYDMAEAFQDGLSVSERLKASQTAQEARIEEQKQKEGHNVLEPEKA